MILMSSPFHLKHILGQSKVVIIADAISYLVLTSGHLQSDKRNHLTPTYCALEDWEFCDDLSHLKTCVICQQVTEFLVFSHRLMSCYNIKHVLFDRNAKTRKRRP